jgi:hypothetical protein
MGRVLAGITIVIERPERHVMEVIEAHDCIAECFRDARANFQVGLNASERLLDLAQQAVPEMEEIDDPSSRGHFIVIGALR